ncbi:hypothetical protein F4808DRAFT_421672 [Astrocystis sublimbata]|nr:hypothetical protein F4808DRAFT_421672 [Astrocystis sublimbata]
MKYINEKPCGLDQASVRIREVEDENVRLRQEIATLQAAKNKSILQWKPTRTKVLKTLSARLHRSRTPSSPIPTSHPSEHTEFAEVLINGEKFHYINGVLISVETLNDKAPPAKNSWRHYAQLRSALDTFSSFACRKTFGKWTRDHAEQGEETWFSSENDTWVEAVNAEFDSSLQDCATSQDWPEDYKIENAGDEEVSGNRSWVGCLEEKSRLSERPEFGMVVQIYISSKYGFQFLERALEIIQCAVFDARKSIPEWNSEEFEEGPHLVCNKG